MALVGGVAVVIQQAFVRPKTITAYFTTATAIYPGDEVRIAGVKVGTIDSIQPVGTQAKMTLHVDRGIRVPADAKAVIVAQNLVSARYVQLAPAYESGPTMRDGAVIPLERTAVPVEWDEVKEQLMRLATELGPNSGMSTGSVGRFIDSAANAHGRQRRQAASDAGPAVRGRDGSWPTAAATSSTRSPTCRPSSPRCVTATTRSCSSRTGSRR